MRTENASAMLSEIKEEQEIFRNILADYKNVTSDFVNLFKNHKFKRIYITGSGSPGFASVVLKYAAVKLLKIDTSYSCPALLNEHEGFNVGGNYLPEEMLLICPAESGKTTGPVIAARSARKMGIPVVCTTLNPQGVLARESDVVIFKPSGIELGLPSTKGHSTGIFLLLLCFIEAAHETQRIDDAEYDSYMEAMRKLPESCADAYSSTLDWFEQHQDLVMCNNRFHVIGYGANYGTAQEIVLKFVESHQKPTIAVELEEFMHGHIRSITRDELIMMICAEDGPEKERMIELYKLLTEEKVGAGCIVIHSKNDKMSFPMEIAFDAENKELVNVIEYLVPLQILSYKIAECMGLDLSVSMGMAMKKAMKPSFTDD